MTNQHLLALSILSLFSLAASAQESPVPEVNPRCHANYRELGPRRTDGRGFEVWEELLLKPTKYDLASDPNEGRTLRAEWKFRDVTYSVYAIYRESNKMGIVFTQVHLPHGRRISNSARIIPGDSSNTTDVLHSDENFTQQVQITCSREY